MQMPGGRRRFLVAAGMVLAVAAATAITYRVLAPAEVSSPARAGYPDPVTVPPKVIGRLSAAPLIVDDRIRVYAVARQVWADQPVNARTRRTPYWSYRRWPAQVTGVVVDGVTVVTRWSDGHLVALDARSGRVVWRTGGPVPEQEEYPGRRTGAATVYNPVGLFTAATVAGRGIVIVTGERELVGVDPTDGRPAWRVPIERGCHRHAATTVVGLLLTVDTCADPQVVEFRDVATGAVTRRWRPPGAAGTLTVEALGCVTGRSRCGGLRTGGDGPERGWLIERGGPVPAPALDTAEAVLVDEVAVVREGDELVARSARAGTVRWRRSEPDGTRVLAAQPGRVHLLTEDNHLITVDVVSGVERSRLRLTVGRDSTDWAPGLAYAAGGFVAVERLNEPVDPAADDQRYYLVPEPVVLAAT